MNLPFFPGRRSKNSAPKIDLAAPLFEIPVTLDRARTLRYSLRSLRRYEKLSGKKVGERDWISSMEDMHQFVFAGAIETDPTITIDEVIPYVRLELIQTVSEHLHQLACDAGKPLLN